MSDFSDRIKKIIEHYKLSYRKFAKIIDIPSSTLNEYLKGRVPPASTIERIYVQYRKDGLSPIWLLTGEGEMLLSGSNKISEDEAPYGRSDESYKWLIGKIMELEQENKELKQTEELTGKKKEVGKVAVGGEKR